MNRIHLLALVVLLGGCASKSTVNNPKAESIVSKMWRLTFDRRLEQNDLAAPILNVDFGSETLPFLVNTASTTHVIDTWAAKATKLPIKNAIIHAPFEINDEVQANANFYVSTLNSRFEENGVAGHLSPQLLTQGKAIAIDFLNSKLYRGEFSELVKLNYGLVVTGAAGRVCPNQGPAEASLYVLQVKIDGQPLNLLVDSSAEDTTISAAHPVTKKLAKDGKTNFSKLHKGTVSVGGKTVERLIDVKEFTDLPCNVDGVLGMDVLKLCTLIFSKQELALNCIND